MGMPRGLTCNPEFASTSGHESQGVLLSRTYIEVAFLRSSFCPSSTHPEQAERVWLTETMNSMTLACAWPGSWCRPWVHDRSCKRSTGFCQYRRPDRASLRLRATHLLLSRASDPPPCFKLLLPPPLLGSSSFSNTPAGQPEWFSQDLRDLSTARVCLFVNISGHTRGLKCRSCFRRHSTALQRLSANPLGPEQQR